MFSLNPITLLEQLPGLILGFTFHEYMHARIAYALGDSHAKDEGRLTLNPLKHIDMMGFLFLMIAGIGWAKPVGFDPSHFKNPKRDEILVSLAGPLSNFFLAFVLFGLCKLSILAFVALNVATNQFTEIWFNMLIIGGYMNLGLFVFNLIPIPPLDGSHIYMTFLLEKNEKAYFILQKYGFAFIMVLILADNFTGTNLVPILPAIRFLATVMMNIFGIS